MQIHVLQIKQISCMMFLKWKANYNVLVDLQVVSCNSAEHDAVLGCFSAKLSFLTCCHGNSKETGNLQDNKIMDVV
jgi:hypothetical protein